MEYESLATTEIRLVSLHPSSDSSLICLNLIPRVPLDVLPAYRPLPYTCGNLGDTEIITIMTCRDYKNLAAGLRQFRQDLEEGPPLILWIHGLCINQRDLDEKTRQIPLMRRI